MASEVTKSPLEGTFHRRKLPPPSIPFSSTEGKTIFQEALLSGGMQVYFPLAEAFQSQGDPSFCGLGSLTTALNAILLDPKRVWRGVWRWFDESMLDCCEPAEVVKLKGLSLAKVHCLARCQGASTSLHYANESTEEDFRLAITRSCREETASPTVIICSYSRSVLKQSGSGHFSPIGGYHAARDLVLIMDVARFKYAPHWVPLSMLFAAMNTIDSDNGMSRGWMSLTSSEEMSDRFTHGCCADERAVEVVEQTVLGGGEGQEIEKGNTKDGGQVEIENEKERENNKRMLQTN